MGKIRDVFKKIGDTQGIFHAKMGTIKDRNDKGLTETGEIKKRQQEYTEQLKKKLFMTQITTMVWSLIQSVKSSGPYYKVGEGDGIPAELIQILNDDAVKVLHSICQQLWKTQQWPKDWKKSVFIPIPKKGGAKRMFKLPNSFTHFRQLKRNGQNLSSQVSVVHELKNSRCTS